MSVRVSRGAGEEQEEVPCGNVASDAIYALEKLFAWLTSERVPVFYAIYSLYEDNKTSYKFGGVHKTPLASVSARLESGGFYDVSISTWEQYYTYVDIDVKYSRENSVTILVIDDAVAVFTRGENLYEYPPRSIESLMFFALNPEVDGIAESVARKSLEDGLIQSGDLRERLETWVYVRNQVAGLRVTEIPQADSDYVITSLINLEGVSGLKKFVGVETVQYYTDGEDSIFMYALSVSDGEFVHKYYTDDERSLNMLIDAMISPLERRTVAKELERITDRVSTVPVVVRTINSLFPEWFGQEPDDS